MIILHKGKSESSVLHISNADLLSLYRNNMPFHPKMDQMNYEVNIRILLLAFHTLP